MSQQIRVCIEKVLDDALLAEAEKRSIAENPANEVLDPVREITVETKWLWQSGKTLRVRFLDGAPLVQRRVEKVAHQWSQHANITFDFGEHKPAEIRISFKLKGESWSWIGTEALTITDQKEPTMNFGWLDPDAPPEVYSSVVLHEFGHALGCVHEHQHPKNPIPWNEDAVYAYYMGPPNNWSKADVYYNVLRKYAKGQTQYSKFDPKSIMLYPVPNAHTKGDWEIDWENAELSETDIKFIRAIYPRLA